MIYSDESNQSRKFFILQGSFVTLSTAIIKFDTFNFKSIWHMRLGCMNVYILSKLSN